MVKYVLYVSLAVFLAACNLETEPSVLSYVQTPLTKGTTSLALDWSVLGWPGRFALADVITYSGARPAITAPVGWTLIREDSSPSTRQALYGHFIQANDKSTQAWTFSEPVDAQGVVLLLDGVAPKDPVDAAAGNAGGGRSLTAKSVTTASDGDLILALYATDFVGTAPGHDLPDSMSEIVDQVEGPHPYWILGSYQRHKGDTEDASCTSGQPFAWVAAQVAIRKGPADSIPP